MQMFRYAVSLPTVLLVAVFALAVFPLGACSTGPRPDPRLIVLDSAAPAAPAGEGRLGRVEVAEYLQRRHPVWRASETVLVERRGQFWGERPESGIRRVLEAELAALRPALPAGARYDVRIDRFEPGPDGRVELRAGWQLAGADGAVLRGGGYQGVEVAAGAPDEAAGVAAAMSRLLGRLARDMATR